MAKSFAGQRGDEKIISVFRRHVITMRKGLIVWLLLFMFSFAVYILLTFFIKFEYKWWIVIGMNVFGLLYFFYHWLLWYFSVSVVTNERIRQISQKSFFKKSVIDISLSKIHSLSYNVPGFLAGLYHYGTIIIQTEVGDLTLTYISHPDKIYDRLHEAVDQAPLRSDKYED